ncbi:MAG: TAT-variant-translocated molybdopterin oxidoreductase [Candidatus Kapaibacteriales bacterium]
MTKPNPNIMNAGNKLVQLDLGDNAKEVENSDSLNDKRKTSKLKNYWLGLKQYGQDPSSPEVIANKRKEFKGDSDQVIDIDRMDDKSRRRFLALMTAGGAFAITSCTDYRDKGTVVPYNKQPEFVQPGLPYHYATSMSFNGRPQSILVKVREGRPIKIDGNPDSPYGGGKVNGYAQASILNLYDPGRLKRPYTNAGLKLDRDKSDPEAWKKIYPELEKKLAKIASSGKEIAIVSNTITSPSFVRALDSFSEKYPTAKTYTYELCHNPGKEEAWKAVYGEGSMIPSIDFDNARLVISLDCDFLGTDGDSVGNSMKFFKTRDFEDLDNFSRLYVAEGGMTVTGGTADYRMRINPADIADFADAIADAIQQKGASQSNMTVSSRKDLASIVEKYGWTNAGHLIDDIISNRGKAIAVAGSHLPADAQAAVLRLNEVIGGAQLYNFDKTDISLSPASSGSSMNDFAKDLSAGRVGAVISVDTDLVYHMAGRGIEEALKKAELLVALASEESETTYSFYNSGVDSYVLPITHYLESWGDHYVGNGVTLMQQPVIRPLWPNTRQKEEVILTLVTGKDTLDGYMNHVSEGWKSSLFTTASNTDFQDFWNGVLHDGFYVADAQPAPRALMTGDGGSSLKRSPEANGFTVQLASSYHMGDGRFATNGFLLEAPHPVSKVSWDNHASISQPTALELGVDYGDMIEVDINGRKLELPVVVQPGMADKLVVVELGWGRKHSGDVAEGAGFNVSVLMGDDGLSPLLYTGAKVTPTGTEYKLVSTQEHHQLDDTSNSGIDVRDFHKIRNIIQEGTVKGYKEVRMEGKDAIKHYLNPHAHEPFSITDEHQYNGHKWQMAIDMNKCSGCTACVIACYVENNIPVVGKEEVGHGREMSWLRVDRYYSGTPENPEMSQQLMLCQHCDNAPCENVCPVVATTHSPDGLNQMVYNRCVGTRYCMNNCPYKVRRFNFYDFRDNLAKGYYYAESMELMMNPEVTVRSRGVVEKCTFCVQRIKEEQTDALSKGYEFRGSQVTTACQDACPANAIYFGDYNEEGSEIREKTNNALGYGVLDFLAVRPNVTYLARLRNIEEEKSTHGENDHHSSGGEHHG